MWFSDPGRFDSVRARMATLEGALGERDWLDQALQEFPLPVWRRGDDLSLTWCNRAYARLVESAPDEVIARGIELLPTGGLGRARSLALRARTTREAQTETFHVVAAGERRLVAITESPLVPGGEVLGFARDVTDVEEARAELTRHVDAHSAVLEALTTAVAIFGGDKRLKFYNRAYARLWRFEENWLATAPHHGELLEQARENRRLPEQADFPAFKRKLLKLYTTLLEPQEGLCHLPDGTTLREVITAHPHGGLLFFYEDVSDGFALERARNTLIAVQQATLDHLSEGVAVFGSDGRLKLYNPVYARIWQLDENFLRGEPHVAEIAEAGRRLIDNDGKWREHKAKIISHTLDRTPRFPRVERADGVVIEFAGVPLPDGRMLFTYLDVTDSTRIERALRDRTEALEAADRLKSEFIENVS